MVTGVATSTGELVIPTKFFYKDEYRAIVEIGPGAFRHKRFTKVTLPTTLRAIRAHAFADTGVLVTGAMVGGFFLLSQEVGSGSPTETAVNT
jgi:hypothetical protein